MFTVDGVEHTSDKTSYAHRGLKKTLAEQELAAIPDDVEVFYDPAEPETAYLSRHRPGLGYGLLAGGAAGVLLALLIAVA